MRILEPLEFGLLATVVYAAVTDIRSGIVPNWCTYGAAAIGIVAAAFFAEEWYFGLVGALTGFSIWLILFATGGVGGGDVKLMAAVGSVVGVAGVLTVSLYAVCLGCLMAVAWLTLSGRMWRMVIMCYHTLWFVAATHSVDHQFDDEKSESIPFAAAIALAVCVYLCEAMLGVSLIGRV